VEWAVRKLTECVDGATRPGNETEITYLELRFADGKAFGEFVSGRDADAVFLQVLYPEEQWLSATFSRSTFGGGSGG
jgi:hypothetical protein